MDTNFKLLVCGLLVASSIFLLLFNREETPTVEYIHFLDQQLATDKHSEDNDEYILLSERSNNSYLFPILIVIILSFIVIIAFIAFWKAFFSISSSEKKKKILESIKKKNKKIMINPFIEEEERQKKIIESKIEKEGMTKRRYEMRRVNKFHIAGERKKRKKCGRSLKKTRKNQLYQLERSNNISIFQKNFDSNLKEKQPLSDAEEDKEIKEGFDKKIDEEIEEGKLGKEYIEINKKLEEIEKNVDKKGNPKNVFNYTTENVKFDINGEEQQRNVVPPTKIVRFTNNRKNKKCLKKLLEEKNKETEVDDPWLVLLSHFYGVQDLNYPVFKRVFVKENIEYKKYYLKNIKGERQYLNIGNKNFLLQGYEEQDAYSKRNENLFFAKVYEKEEQILMNEQGDKMDLNITGHLDGFINYMDKKKMNIAVSRTFLIKNLPKNDDPFKFYTTQEEFFYSFFKLAIEILFPYLEDKDDIDIKVDKCLRVFNLKSVFENIKYGFKNFFFEDEKEKTANNRAHYFPESSYFTIAENLKEMLFHAVFLHNLSLKVLSNKEFRAIRANVYKRYPKVGTWLIKIYEVLDKYITDYVQKNKK